MTTRPPDDYEEGELPEWLRTLFSRESLFFQAGVVLAGLFALYLLLDLLRGAYTNWLWFSTWVCAASTAPCCSRASGSSSSAC